MSINKKGKSILILGANAGMAQPLIHLLFDEWQQCTFYLLARDITTLQTLAHEGERKGHSVKLHNYDLLQPAPLSFYEINYCITYAGWLPPDNSEPEKTMLVNFTGIQQFLDKLIAENQQSLEGIIITGSIAGVRVRPANKSYGLAKQALHHYALQLQQKWAGKIAITLVIPGYVKTKMLEGMNTPAALTLSPQILAKKYMGWMEQKPTQVYSQPAWRWIGFILKLLPDFVIARMKK